MEFTADDWRGLVRIMSGMHHTRATLLNEHVANIDGKCCGCTVPGLGMPGERWPCKLYSLAAQAETLAVNARKINDDRLRRVSIDPDQAVAV